MTVAKTPKKSPNRNPPWKPGQAGNPKGRPQGFRNAATPQVEDLLDGEAEGLPPKCIDMALVACVI